MNVKMHLITDAIVSVVDTRRFVYQMKHSWKECRQEFNVNFITNCWARIATRRGWALPLLPGLP